MPIWKSTRQDRDELRAGADASSIGWFFFAAIGLGYLAGLWIDKHFHVSPWGSVCGAMFGVAAGFVNLVQVANRLSKMEDEADRRRKNGE